MSAIFTQAALQGRTLPELRALFNQAQRVLTVSQPGSQERREALANLDTLSRVIAQRYRAPSP